MMEIIYKNFKCEDCDNDKFTIKDNFEIGVNEFTIYCTCGASYTFIPEMKLRHSYHPSKRCSCGVTLLSRDDKYCSNCGRKNLNYKKRK
jgi:hypothetical protein